MFQIQIVDELGALIDNFVTGTTQAAFEAGLTPITPDVSTHLDGSLKSFQAFNSADYLLKTRTFNIDIRVNGRLGIAVPTATPDLWDIETFRFEQLQNKIPDKISIVLNVHKIENYFEGIQYGRIEVQDPNSMLSFINTKKEANFTWVEQQRTLISGPDVVVESNASASKLTRYKSSVIVGSINHFESLNQPVKVRISPTSEVYNSLNFHKNFGWQAT